MLLAGALLAALAFAVVFPSVGEAYPYPNRLPEVVYDNGQPIAQAEVGMTLECGTGSWTGFPEKFEYEWERNGVPITLFQPPVPGQDYTVQAADQGKTLTCVVDAQGEGGETEAESSNGVSVGGSSGPPPEPPVPPTGAEPSVHPEGTASVGAELTCEAGQWGGNPAPSFTYEWLSEQTNKVGEGSRYVVKESDEGHKLWCEVIAHNEAGTKSALSKNGVQVQGEPPGEIEAPKVQGNDEVGATLTCNPGRWTGAPTFTYAWSDERGPISGQTGSTYVVGSGEEGRNVYCTVYAKNSSGTREARSEPVLIGGSKPVLSEAPTLTPSSRTVKVGETVKCSSGSWDGTPAPSFEYAWKRNGNELAGSTSSLKVESVDAGKTLACQVTAKNSHGSAVVSTFATLAIEPGSEKTLSGGFAAIEQSKPAVGSTITCETYGWSPSPSSESFEWLRGSTPVGTGSSYTVQETDVGAKLSCKARAFYEGYAGEATSTAITITGSAPKPETDPSISGNPVIGETLTCSTGAWSGSPAPSFEYEWLRDNSATSVHTSGYQVGTEDAGQTIKCVVTAKNTEATVSAPSNEVRIPGERPHALVAPAVTGEAKPNAVLKCSRGEWSGAPAPSSYSYQWVVEGAPVPGQTSTSYTVPLSQEGRSITCIVTAYNSEGSTEAESNAVHIPGKPPRLAGVNPEIVGFAAVGSELICERGVWEGKPPPVFHYQWLLDEVPISGANGADLSIEPAYQGHLLTCAVTATSTEGSYEADTQGVAIPYASTGTKTPDAPGKGSGNKSTPRVTIAEVLTSLGKQLPHEFKSARRSKVLKSKSFSFTLSSLEAGTLVISWYQVPKGAHVSASKPKPILIASSKNVFKAAGKQKVKIALTKLGTRILQRTKHLKLTVEAEFKTPKGAHGTWTETFVLAP